MIEAAVSDVAVVTVEAVTVMAVVIRRPKSLTFRCDAQEQKAEGHHRPEGKKINILHLFHFIFCSKGGSSRAKSKQTIKGPLSTAPKKKRVKREARDVFM